MVVLATKVYVEGEARDRALASLDSIVANAIGGLEVDWTVGLRHDAFPTVTIDGPDAVAARNTLREAWGEITPELDNGEEYVGTLSAWDESGFVLDAGQEVHIPADGIGLGPGSPPQVRQRFGLVQHLGLRFDNGEPASLATAEHDRLFGWTRGPGRVNVNSATRSEVRATVNRAGHADDIVGIDRLGLLEQSIICAEGTDPPGLLSSIGDYLPSELLCVIP